MHFVICGHSQCFSLVPAASEIHRLKKRLLPAGFLAGDESVKHNGHFNPSLSHLNLIFSRQPNFLATTLHSCWVVKMCRRPVVSTATLRFSLAKNRPLTITIRKKSGGKCSQCRLLFIILLLLEIFLTTLS